jgi:hypothetical protein
MKRLLTSPLFLLLLVCALTGCSSDSPTTSAAATGALEGWILPFNPEWTDAPRAGSMVAVEGTNFSATTDSLGHWRIGNLPAGTYDLSFSRSGYAPHRVIGFQFVGGGTAYLPAHIPLWEQTTATISELRAVVVDTFRNGASVRSVHVTGRLTLSPNDEMSQGLLAIGGRNTVSVNTIQQLTAPRIARHNLTNDLFEEWIPLSTLGTFPSGTQMHVLGYGYQSASDYYDPRTNRTFSPNVTTPDTASFVMP